VTLGRGVYRHSGKRFFLTVSNYALLARQSFDLTPSSLRSL
jgi:hypothetical protein